MIQGTSGTDVVLVSSPRNTRHEPILVEASARSKAPLVCQTGAPSSTSLIVVCSRHLGAPRPHVMHLNTREINLDTRVMHLNTRELILNGREVNLNTREINLNTRVMHLNTREIDLNTRVLHLNSLEINLNSRVIHLNMRVI